MSNDFHDKLFDFFVERMEGNYDTSDESIVKRMKRVGLLTDAECDDLLRKRNSPSKGLDSD